MMRPGLVDVRHGMMMVYRDDEYIGKQLAWYGEYIEAECRILRRLVPKGGVAVDVGANIGATAIPMAEAAGETGVVVAFEPQRLVHHLLCGNVALAGLRNVYCLHKAAGKEPGAVMVPDFHLDKPGNYGGLSLLDSKMFAEQKHDMCPVDMIRVDDLRLARCDLIKVDVEGMELDVLEGARRTIEGHMPALCVEDDRPDLVPKLVAWLWDAGYEIFQHFPRIFNPDNFKGVKDNIYGETVAANLVAFHKGRGVPTWAVEEGLALVPKP